MKLKNSFAYLSGIPSVTEHDVFELVIQSEVVMLNRYKKFGIDFKILQAYQIPLCNILDVTQVVRQKAVLRDNSVIGSGLGRGFSGGADGMTLGAISPLKTEEIIKTVFVVIAYLNENTPEDPKKIIFECSGEIADYSFYWKNNEIYSVLRQAVNNTRPSPMVSAMREKAR